MKNFEQISVTNQNFYHDPRETKVYKFIFTFGYRSEGTVGTMTPDQNT